MHGMLLAEVSIFSNNMMAKIVFKCQNCSFEGSVCRSFNMQYLRQKEKKL